MHFIGDRQPFAPMRLLQLGFQQLEIATSPLIGQQPAVQTRTFRRVPVLIRVPFLQRDPQACRSSQPLAGNGAAVTKHHQPLQAALPFQLFEAEQGSEGLPGARPSVDQHIGMS